LWMLKNAVRPQARQRLSSSEQTAGLRRGDILTGVFGAQGYPTNLSSSRQLRLSNSDHPYGGCYCVPLAAPCTTLPALLNIRTGKRDQRAVLNRCVQSQVIASRLSL
jgi:hypothetical protein